MAVKIEEGAVGPGQGYRRMTDAAIKQLALDVVEGRVFGSWQLHASERDSLLPVVFMPIIFLDAITIKQIDADDIVHFYEYTSSAMPRGVNGCPTFGSMRMLDREDARRLDEQVKKLHVIRKAFLENDDG